MQSAVVMSQHSQPASLMLLGLLCGVRPLPLPELQGPDPAGKELWAPHPDLGHASASRRKMHPTPMSGSRGIPLQGIPSILIWKYRAGNAHWVSSSMLSDCVLCAVRNGHCRNPPASVAYGACTMLPTGAHLQAENPHLQMCAPYQGEAPRDFVLFYGIGPLKP